MVERRGLVAVEHEETSEAASSGEYDLAQGEAQEIVADESPYEETWEDDVPRARFGWVVPTLAVLAILGWSAFFGWAHQEEILSGATPQQWSDLIVAWAVPVLLVVALWLLAMRTSRREAARFNDAAQALSRESVALERRLAVVNRELSLARDFIASQSRDLESLGRIASERLSTHADRLQDLIRDNGAQVNAIGEVSETALGNMDRLRDHLPVIANSARDVASQIGQAGNTAQEQLSELASGFDHLHRVGEASTRHVEIVRSKVSETLQAFQEQTSDLEQTTTLRFEALRGHIEELRTRLEEREAEALAALRRRSEELDREMGEKGEAARALEAEALAAIRQRAESLGSQLDAQREAASQIETEALAAMRQHFEQLHERAGRIAAELHEGQEGARSNWHAAIEQLEARMRQAIGEISRIDEAAMDSARQRLASLTEEAARVDRSILASAEAFAGELARRREQADELQSQSIGAMEQRMAEFDASESERREQHLAHVAKLGERGEALAQRLAALDREMQRLAAQGGEEGARLGEAADLLADKLSQSRAILEESGTFVSRLTDDSVRLLEIIRASSDHSAGALSDSIGEAEGRLSRFETHMTALHGMIAEAEAKGAELAGHIERTGKGGAESMDSLAALEERLAQLSTGTEALARQAREELRAAIDQLGEAATQAVEKLRSDEAETIRQIAHRIAAEGNAAIAQALSEGSRQAIAELEQASVAAGNQGRETARLLHEQLARVDELAGNLEHRVAQARERAEEHVDGDFARRVALITESLNSSAIDISKAFDTEVTDTAWASYLRGDRGIFTRRAVRLLGSNEARSIADFYQEDGEFRETVNHYIHDFEGMLRHILSTRDGHTLAVTLLSSDMGKLYVALAQAIERLRD